MRKGHMFENFIFIVAYIALFFNLFYPFMFTDNNGSYIPDLPILLCVVLRGKDFPQIVAAKIFRRVWLPTLLV